MPQIDFIRDLVVIFGISVLVAVLFHRLYFPSIVGFLISGALVGPYGLNLVGDLHRVELFAEVGVVLLLFTIGLEFSLAKLARIRRFAISGGALQVGLTILLTALTGLVVHLSLRAGIFWGFLLALSSTAIVLKMLMERGELDAPQGRLSIAILIFQDLIVVPMMMILPVLGGTTSEEPVKILLTLGRSLLLIGAILAAAAWVVPKALSLVVRVKSRELFVITVIMICAGIAWLAGANGLSLAVGAFIAGLVISESEYSHQALADIMPFRDSFISLFFVSIGMLLDVGQFMERLIFILPLTIGVLLLKGAVAGGVTLLLGYPLRVAVLVGLTLPQVGEFSFVLAQAGQPFGLLTPAGYQTFLQISILTMIVTPFLIRVGPSLAARAESVPRLRRWVKGGEAAEAQSHPAPLRNHVIIAGYGLNGLNLARVLKEMNVPYVILDLHWGVVQRGRALGEPLYFGDVTQSEVLRQVGIGRARVLVLAVSDPFGTRRAIQAARQNNPNIHIVVRTRYVREVDDLLDLGAHKVVPEEFETSLGIFDLVLQQYGVPPREIWRKQEEIRRESYSLLRGKETEQSRRKNPPVDVEVHYGPIRADSEYVGKNLAELRLTERKGVRVTAVIRSGEAHPAPDEAFQVGQGDILVMTGTRDEIERTVQDLRGQERK
jgi:CPA2 family monovalent cation:H+ antiporter-2